MINKVESSLKLDLEDEMHRGEPVRAVVTRTVFRTGSAGRLSCRVWYCKKYLSESPET